MAKMRGRRGLQKQPFFGSRKFCERRNQGPSVCVLDYRLVARELAIQRHPRSGQPNEGMKPQDRHRDFIEQADQVVAPSRVGQLVHEDSIEFLLTEQAIESTGKQDARAKNALDCGSRIPVVEVHWHAIGKETFSRTMLL